jgi:RHS repeat-associated protein
VNNVQTITDAVNSGDSQSFSYDNLQRLSAATGGYGSFGFTYDNDGNRLSQTFGTVTTGYGYGTGNDLLATISVGGITTQTIGYTADGRMSSLSPGIQAPGGQFITSLSYNQNARLSAVDSSNGALASYTYDGFGQRLIKTVSSTYGEIYQYGQNGMLLEETNQSGTAQADYIYLNGRPIADLAPATGTFYSLQDDMLGTPQLATDSSQNIQWQASYDVFGQASVSGTVTQNLRLPGQYFDVESGWNHNGFRNYIPDLGRYVEPDPLGRFGGGNNLYVYVGDNPANLIDPLGLCTPKKCADLLKNIMALANQVQDRTLDYMLPTWNLPTYGPKMTRESHINKIQETQDALQRRMKEYNDENCPDPLPEFAQAMATEPIPEVSPSPAGLPTWSPPTSTPMVSPSVVVVGGTIIIIVVIILSPVGA